MLTSKVVGGFELKTSRQPNGHRKLTGVLMVRELSTVLSTNVHVQPNAPGAVPSGSVTRRRIIVGPGFTTDLSSVPTPLQWVVRWSQVDVAGVVHDFLYRDTNIPRAVADDVWWELARSGAVGVGRCRAWLCWVVLRGCGSFNRPAQPERHVGWLAFAAGVLLVVLVLMLPILFFTSALWLTDRIRR